MDERRQTIANLLVSDDPADHAKARELHAKLREMECRYVIAANETGSVFFVEPDELTVRERVWLSLWTIFCCGAVVLVCWGIALGVVAFSERCGFIQ